MMFGIPLEFLDASSYEDATLIDNAFDHWLLNLVYNQYLLALGKDRLSNF